MKNDGRLLVRGLVKLPGKARPNGLSNSRKEFHQTTYQKPSALKLNQIIKCHGDSCMTELCNISTLPSRRRICQGANDMTGSDIRNS